MSAGLLAGCGSSPTSPGPVTPPTTPPSDPPPPPPPATPATLRISKVLAFGDSITYGVDSPPLMLRALDAGISQSYPFKLQSLLATRYSGQSVSVFNAGIGGKNAWEDRDRLAGMVSETHPDLVLLMEGANDLNSIGPPSTNAKIDSTVAHMEDMVRDTLARGIPVVVATLPPQREGGKGHGIPYLDEVQQRPEDDGVEEGGIHRRCECAVPGVADWCRWPAPDRAGISAHRRDDVRRYQVALRNYAGARVTVIKPGAIDATGCQSPSNPPAASAELIRRRCARIHPFEPSVRSYTPSRRLRS